ncbi:MAG: EI24 domain-containing protein [Burkholderiaceae bacterium]|nr:EI24 domain-containing protein [Burkholderiaceae bacterium]
MMRPVLDALWRAAAYCVHPRVILLSLLPVAVAGAAGFALAWFYWEGAVEAVRLTLEQLPLLAPVVQWLNDWTQGTFRTVIGPLVVVVLSVPVLLIAALLLVSAFMAQAIVSLVARRRFPTLERRYGGAWWRGLLAAAWATLLALLALVVTLPLWWLPPVALLLPPLIWGWLSFRVLSYDALAEHASADERHLLLRERRNPLLAMGVVTGYLGVLPSLVWATGVLALPMMPLLLPLFVWLYTLVFAFASLWFTHYALAALDELRRRRAAPPPAPASAVPLPGLPSAAPVSPQRLPPP